MRIGVLIDVDHARFKSVRDVTGVVGVSPKHGAGKSEFGTVRQRDRLILVRDAVDHGDRSEQLFAECAGRGSDVGQERRRHERPDISDPMATRHECRPVGHGVVNLPDKFLNGAEGRQRPKVRLRISRVSSDIRLQLFRKAVDESVVHGIDNDETLRRGTCLAGIAHPARRCGRDGDVKVLSVEDDERVTSA